MANVFRAMLCNMPDNMLRYLRGMETLSDYILCYELATNVNIVNYWNVYHCFTTTVTGERSQASPQIASIEGISIIPMLSHVNNA